MFRIITVIKNSNENDTKIKDALDQRFENFIVKATYLKVCNTFATHLILYKYINYFT